MSLAPPRTDAAADQPRFSLLRLSALERLAGASAIVAVIWLAVWWAMAAG